MNNVNELVDQRPPPPPPPGGVYSTGIWVGGFVFKTLKTVHKFAFSHISMKAHEISENYVIEGGERGRFTGRTL